MADTKNRMPLPLQGNQYWGAALNTYLRQLEDHISSLESQLQKQTANESVNGSGFMSGYSLNINGSNSYSGWVQDDDYKNISLYESINDNTTKLYLNLVGDIRFIQNNGQVHDFKANTEDNKVIINFKDDNNKDGFYPVKWLEEKAGNFDIISPTSEKTFFTQITKKAWDRNYYPLYIHYISTNDKSAIEIVAGNYGYMYDKSFVLIGVICCFTNCDKPLIRIVKKCDSSAKSIYNTRQENRNSYATLIGTGNSAFAQKKDNGQLELNFGSLTYILTTNGINALDNANDVGTTLSKELDSKKFTPSLKRKVIIYKVLEGSKPEHIYKIVDASTGTFDIANDVMSDGAGKNYLDADYPLRSYAVYVTITGDIVIECGPKGYSNAEQYQWNLPYDSNFDAGGLVLIGSYYPHKDSKGVTTVGWAPAVTSGISPSLMTVNTLQSTPHIELNSTDFIYRNNSNVRKMHMNFAEGTTDNIVVTFPFIDEQNYVIPLLQSSDFEYGKTTDNSSIKFKNLTATNTGVNIKGTLTITNDSASVVIEKGITLDDTAVMPIKILNGGSILCGKDVPESDSVSSGPNLIATLGSIYAGKNLHVIENATINKDLTANDFTFKEKKIAVGNGGTTLNLTANNVSFDNFKFLSESNKATLETTQEIHIKGPNNTSIQFENNLNFTSDIRCKKNIKDIDNNICYDAIKNIDVKSFNYLNSDKDVIGLIAQDIEKYLPQYKDMLIDIIDDGNLPDKRTVSEHKLIFILWSALQHVINKIEGDDK